MKASEIRELGDEERLNKLNDLKHELFNLRFQHAIGQLENQRKIKETQKDIARIHTVIKQMARNPKDTDN